MLKKAFLSAMLMTLLAIPASGNSIPDFEPGQWEITVDFEIPGMPMQMPPNTYSQCITKDNFVPKDEKPNQQCKNTEVTTKGNTVFWKIECTNAGGKMTGQGTITYKKDKMDGSMIMSGQGMQMTSRFKGKRIGNCP